MLAQLLPVETAEIIKNITGTWEPVVAALSPILLGLITSERTRTYVRMALPALWAIILGVIGILTQDGVTWQTLMLRIPALWILMEQAFRLYSGFISTVKHQDVSLNDVLGKDKGLIR